MREEVERLIRLLEAKIIIFDEAIVHAMECYSEEDADEVIDALVWWQAGMFDEAA